MLRIAESHPQMGKIKRKKKTWQQRYFKTTCFY